MGSQKRGSTIGKLAERRGEKKKVDSRTSKRREEPGKVDVEQRRSGVSPGGREKHAT